MASYRPFSSENPICRRIFFRTRDRAFSLRRRLFSIRIRRTLLLALYSFWKGCFRKPLLPRRRQSSKQAVPLPRRRALRFSEEKPPLPRFPHFSPLPLIYVKENVSLLLRSGKLLRLRQKLSHLLLSVRLPLPYKVSKKSKKVCSPLSPFNKTSRPKSACIGFYYAFKRLYSMLSSRTLFPVKLRRFRHKRSRIGLRLK